MSDNPEDSAPAVVRDDGLAWMWAPYAASAVCAGAGFGLRSASGGAALGIAAVTLLAPAIVLGAAHRLGRPVFGIDQTGEVAYLAGCLSALAGWMVAVGLVTWPLAVLVTIAVVAGAVGWLAYGPGKTVAALAGAAGAAAGVLAGAALNPFAHAGLIRWVVAWVAGTTLAAAPYWLHRRDRRSRQVITADVAPTVDPAPLVAAVTKHLHSPVAAVPGSLTVGEHGRYSVRLRLSNGKTARDTASIIVPIESELSLREGAVMVQGYRQRRDEVTITVVPAEPVIDPHQRPALPTSITEPAPLGQHDNGTQMAVSIYDETGARGGLAGGIKGSGKSRALWTLMESWTNCDDVLFCFADLSGGATSNPWMPCIHARVTDEDKVKSLIDALLGEATARAATLSDRDWESWRPSPADPAIVFVIDEAQKVLKTDWPTRVALENLMQVDRKSGISCVVLCPNPVSTEGISPTIREMAVGLRACFHSLDQAVKWVLGDTPAAPVSHVVAEFDKPGQLLAYGPGLAPIPGRTHDTDLARAKQVAARNAARRPSPAGLLTPALREFDPTANGVSTVDTRTNDQAWTPADDAAAHAAAETDPAMREQLLALSTGSGVLGHTWPEHPEVPAIPSGRLSSEQALQVAAAMLAQPGGTTPAAVQQATRRSRSWAFDVLGRWVRQGVAIQPEEGRYVAAGDSPQQAA